MDCDVAALLLMIGREQRGPATVSRQPGGSIDEDASTMADRIRAGARRGRARSWPGPSARITAADEAMKLARKLTEEGAATFSKADAKAMAAYYTEDAIVFLQSKGDDGHSVKEYDGRAEIERLYADLFKEPRDDPGEEHRRLRQAAGPRPPGDRRHLRAQPARGQADEVAVLPGPRQAGREVADPQPAGLRAAREELVRRTPGCLTVWEMEAPPAIGSGDGAPSYKGNPARPVVFL